MLLCNPFFSAMLRNLESGKHLCCYILTVFYTLLAIYAFFNSHYYPMEATSIRTKRASNTEAHLPCEMNMLRQDDDGRCVSRCREGYIKRVVGKPECLRCKEPCKTCVMNVENCSSCLKGFIYSRSNKTDDTELSGCHRVARNPHSTASRSTTASSTTRSPNDTKVKPKPKRRRCRKRKSRRRNNKKGQGKKSRINRDWKGCRSRRKKSHNKANRNKSNNRKSNHNPQPPTDVT